MYHGNPGGSSWQKRLWQAGENAPEVNIIPIEPKDLLLQNRDLTKAGRAFPPAPLPDNGFSNERLPTAGY
jgi:hypothetical protein